MFLTFSLLITSRPNIYFIGSKNNMEDAFAVTLLNNAKEEFLGNIIGMIL